MTADERWLGAMWPFVSARLPPPPARVLELGCGRVGGFVPMLRPRGYEAIGIDPNAPPEPYYQRVEFERAQLPEPVDAVVASVSLHHVTDPAAVVDQIASVLVDGGTLIVIEWASEEFDEATARWCFERLTEADGHGWLQRHRENWMSSGQPWDVYLSDWTRSEGIHAGHALLEEVDRRFDREVLSRGPYVFADLPGTAEADEQAAIDRGEIRATRIDYVGRLAAA